MTRSAALKAYWAIIKGEIMIGAMYRASFIFTVLSNLLYIVQVGTSMESVGETLQRFLVLLVVAIPIALTVSLAGGWFLAGRALRPVDKITLAAQRIAGDVGNGDAHAQRSGADPRSRFDRVGAGGCRGLGDQRHRAAEADERRREQPQFAGAPVACGHAQRLPEQVGQRHRIWELRDNGERASAGADNGVRQV